MYLRQIENERVTSFKQVGLTLGATPSKSLKHEIRCIKGLLKMRRIKKVEIRPKFSVYPYKKVNLIFYL
jgi:hypothetical protein